MKYYDSHTHLNNPKLITDIDDILQKFVDVGGVGLINIGVDIATSQEVIDLSRYICAHTDLRARCSVGIHPDAVYDTQAIDQLSDMIDTHRDMIVAIGEIGTDLHSEVSDIDYKLQQDILNQQCMLARKYNLPVVIHSRDDFVGTMSILEEYDDLQVYFHCRGYGPDEINILRSWKEDDLWIGFCGNISYPKAQNLRDSCIRCHELGIHILLETDAPYLSPQVVRGTTNHPANVSYIYQYVADLLHIPLVDICNIVGYNFEKLYRYK